MWKPLTIISGVILAAAGGFNYVKIRPAVLAEAEHTKNAAENYTAVTTGPAGLEKATEARKLVEKSIDEVKQRIKDRTGNKESASKALEDSKLALKTKQEEFETAKAALEAEKQKIKDYGDIDTMAQELKTLEATYAQLTKDIEDTNNATTAAVAHKAQTEKDIAALAQRQFYQQTGIMEESFTSRISAVNTDYGFVMLPAGNSRNVVRKAKLDIKRGDTIVGKAIVTNVNPKNAIASIVPGSVAAGDSILPGDTVVVGEGSRPRDVKTPGAAPAKKSATPDAAAPAAETPAAADPFAAPAEGTAPAADPAAAPATEDAPAEAPMNN